MPPSHDPRCHPNYPSSYDDIIRYFQESSHTAPSVIERLNVEQMFILIDGILPIEACLYYEVLPLFLEGSRLNLGMVSLDDTSALDYVRRIVSYLNYSLVSYQISSNALRASLTAYLRYTDEKSRTQALPEPSAASRRAKRLSERENAPPILDSGVQPTLIVDGPETLDPSEVDPDDFPSYPKDWSIDDASTITISLFDESAPDWETVDEASQPSPVSDGAGVRKCVSSPDDEDVDFPAIPDVLDVDDGADEAGVESLEQKPEALSERGDSDEQKGDRPSPSTASHASRKAPASDGVSEKREIASDPTPSSTPSEKSTSSVSSLLRPQAQPFVSNRSKSSDSAIAPASVRAAPSGLLRSPQQLELKVGDRRVALEELHALTPPDLLQQLLVRVLDQGIGRLYFERNPQSGRILWSESGVVQSVVEDLTHDRFTQVVEALKGLTRLVVQATDKPLQIELERMYQNERLLLRFRFIPTKFGEEATLQVLRGAALRFYQQQQLSKLSRDALSTAQALQTKVNAIRDRMLAASDPSGTQPSMPPAIAQMINQIEAQLEALRQSHIDTASQPSPSQDTSGNS